MEGKNSEPRQGHGRGHGKVKGFDAGGGRGQGAKGWFSVELPLMVLSCVRARLAHQESVWTLKPH